MNELLRHLVTLGAELRRDGEHLRVHAPELNAERRASLRQHKEALLAFVDGRGGHFRAAPLTWGQAALWSLYQLNPQSAVYNLMVVFQLRPDVDTSRLKTALDRLVMRHESLRTTVDTLDDQPMQVIHAHGEADFAVLEGEAETLLETELTQPFDLVTGPLMRCRLISGGLLAVTIHHLISDFLTFAVIRDELNRLYDVVEEPAAPATQFRHFVRHQNHWLQSRAGEAAIDYWRQRLADEPPTLNLPLDHPRPPVQGFRGARHTYALSDPLSDRIRSFAAEHGVTPFMVLLTVHQLFLRRITGQEHFALGAFVAGRNHPSLESLLGYLANPVVILADVVSKGSFHDNLAHVRQTTLEAMAHEDVPFALLVERLGVKRDPRYSPLFQAVFLWEFAQWERDVTDGDVVRDVVKADQGGAPFDLILSVSDRGVGPFTGLWLYNADIFEPTTIARFHEHFQTLLTALMSKPEQPCHTQPLLSQAQITRAWETWNDTAETFPTDQCLHELVVDQALRTPDAPAVIDETGVITYAQILHHANLLARDLLAQGAEPEALVAVVMDKGWRQVAAVIGVNVAGAAYLPIDPIWPADRRAQILEQGRVRIAVVDDALTDDAHWPQHMPRLHLDAKPDAQPTDLERLPRRQQPDQLAYVIFTSGSSGKPKGVAIEHAAAVNTLHDVNRYHHMGPADRILGLSSLSFDLSVYDIYGLLGVGGALVLPSAEEAKSPAAWARLVREHRVTFWNTVPALMQLLVNHCETDDQVDLSTLKAVMMSGDWIPVDLPDRIRALSPQTAVFSYGGATEASIWSIRYPIGDVDSNWRSIPYGKAMANQSFFVLDEHLDPCPVGVAGDLYIGGVGVARCYFGDEVKTKASFITHPRRGERLYRTGDLGRYFPNGDIEFLGRVDFQVKVNGFRIELNEIEAVLLQHAAVQEAAVTVREGKSGKFLAGYVTLLDPSANVAELKTFVATKLPEYMVPATLSVLESMPLTANGKVNRKALPEPEAPSGDARPEAAPQTPEEIMLAEIWAEVLGVAAVGRYDNYFELGGDSILGIQIIARAARKGLKITAAQLFRHASVAELATVAERIGELDRQTPSVGPAPLTPIQRWFFQAATPTPEHFTQSLLLQLPEDVTPDRLRDALRALTRIHDALRLRFERDGDVWRQEVATETGETDVTLIELPEFDRAKVDEHIAQAQHGLSLSDGRLMRAVLMRAPQTPPHLIWSVHHLVVDGVSWPILTQDLHELLRGEEPARPRLSYKAWAEHLPRQAKEADAEPWAEIHRRGAVFQLSTDMAERTTHDLLIDLDILQPLLARSRRQGLDEILLTALTIALGGGVYVDVEGHGRDDDALDASGTVGWFTTIHPVVLDLSEVSEPGARLTAVNNQLANTPPTREYGLARYLNAAPSLQSGSPQILFNFLGDLRNAGMVDDPLSAHGQGPVYRLEINALIQTSGLRIRLDGDLLDLVGLGTKLVETAIDLIEHAVAPDQVTPADFPDATVDAERLQQLAASYDLEDLLPMTAQQQGVLYHAVADPDSDAYVVHLMFRTERALDWTAFRRAWDGLVTRHDTFRSAYLDVAGDQPLQVVVGEASMPWFEHDLRGDDPRQALVDLLRADRAQGFDLSQAPLSRCLVCRTGEETYTFVWSHHHVVCDGWSFAILLNELFQLYRAETGADQAALSEPADPRAYQDWRRRFDAEPHQTWWRDRLAGFTHTTPLSPDWEIAPPQRGEQPSFEVARALKSADAKRLNDFARAQGLTPHVLIMGAWALILRHLSGHDDLVFGVTHAGRPPEARDVERQVGLFINSVPVRLQLHDDRPLLDWLTQLQHDHQDTTEHALLPLSEILRQSELEPGQPPFEALLVVENYPVDEAFLNDVAALGVRDLGVDTRNSFPLTLNATPREDFRLKVMVHDARIDRARAEEIVGYGVLLLDAFSADVTLGDLLTKLRDQDQAARARDEEAALALASGKRKPKRRRRS